MSIDNTVVVSGVEEMAYEFVRIMGRYQELAGGWEVCVLLAGWKSGGVDGSWMTAEFVVLYFQSKEKARESEGR